MARPATIAPGAAIGCLRAWQVNAASASGGLRRTLQVAKVLSLFERFFPAEHQKHACRLIGDPAGQHRALEAFFTLICRHLFPLPDHIFDFEEDLEAYLGGITVLPLIPEWWNGDAEELGAAHRVALGLLHGGEWALDGLGPYTARVKTGQAYAVDWELLERLCGEAPPPLAHLWPAVTSLDHSTGNPFIDSSYEAPWEEDWGEESVQMLTAAYQEAVELLKKVDELDAWVQEDPTRVGQIVELWNRAVGLRCEGKG